jgi:ABC-type polysaccharide/polyol phosphate export permease
VASAEVQGEDMATQLPVYDSGAIRFRGLFEIKEFFRYRFLVLNLVSRDLKVRYKRSVLGFVWVMLSPLLTMGVLVIVFSSIFRFNVPHYAAYLLVGLLLWSVFAQGTVAAMSNLVGNGSVLRRMYVPPSVFVASAIGSALVNLIFSLVPFAILAYLTGVEPSLWWLFLVVPCFLVTLFAFGVGLVLSSMAVYFTDTVEIWTVLLSVYFYLTPVIYPATTLGPIVFALEQYNPMYLFLNIARTVVIYGAPPALDQLAWATGFAVVACLIGWFVFTRLESRFAYHL